MRSLKLPLAVWILFMAIGLSLQLWYWPQLPQQMAIHFDASGAPDDWMDKFPAVLLSGSLVTLLPVFFMSIGQLSRLLPKSMINIPHREYWLSTQKREETQRWMATWLTWFSVTITGFMIVINHLTFVANRDAKPLSAFGFWGALITFLLVTSALVCVMILRFRKPGCALNE